jgi:hypothetical protein
MNWEPFFFITVCHFDRREKSFAQDWSAVDCSLVKDFSLVPRSK